MENDKCVAVETV